MRYFYNSIIKSPSTHAPNLRYFLSLYYCLRSKKHRSFSAGLILRDISVLWVGGLLCGLLCKTAELKARTPD